jgi:proteasome-associated ATPase
MSTDQPQDPQVQRERLDAERRSLEAEIAALRSRGEATPAQLRAVERELGSSEPCATPASRSSR